MPTSYLPNKEFRFLRNILRHRAFRKKIQTALKNRTWSEFWKRRINPELNLSSNKGRELASSFNIYEVNQNLQAIELLENQIKQIEGFLKKRYSNIEPVKLLQKIEGIGLLTALTIYAEIVDINRFSNPDKLAHYVGLVPRVKQSGDITKIGRETKGNKWLKWVLIEAAWAHIRACPNGRLAKIFKQALKRKKSKSKAIKTVARKLVNIIWAIWKYKREFDAYKGLR